MESHRLSVSVTGIFIAEVSFIFFNYYYYYFKNINLENVEKHISASLSTNRLFNSLV